MKIGCSCLGDYSQKQARHRKRDVRLNNTPSILLFLLKRPSGCFYNVLLSEHGFTFAISGVVFFQGHLIVDEFQEFKMHENLSLVVPSSITDHCKRAEVEALSSDTWMEPKNPIFPWWKPKFQLANVEKAYAGLAKSHGELSILHNKMKKWEKSRDKLFTRMWKRVKGLWKFLKANKPLPTSRRDEDRYKPTTWRFGGGDEDMEDRWIGMRDQDGHNSSGDFDESSRMSWTGNSEALSQGPLHDLVHGRWNP
ncbi:hypothetical protein H5410_041093 [Solanum commersonii]|uniref:Uncharacterized protein n=1 Tax=Solanum commersonii TaxID=4109 RepID=A0A9J5XQM4_SOLCO|nr:hypothetical protein H5410_041093 [Solanum commersonii]